MMTDPVCSVVIPTWNGRDLVERCLTAMLQIVDPEHVEIIVVDDGSADHTFEHIRHVFPQVITLRHERNEGYGAACNAGVGRSRSDIVILLNNDILVEPGFVGPLLAHFRDQDVFAVNPRVFQADGITPGGGLVRGCFHAGLLRLRWSEDPEERDHPALTLYANGAATAIHRRKFLELGGFDALYAPFYSEDLDLSYRAWQRGWIIRYEPASRVRHVHGATIGALFDSRTIARVSKRNRILFVWKNIRSARYLIAHILWMLPRAIGALIRMDTVFLIALVDALTRLNQIRKWRKGAPSVSVSDREILRITAQWARKG